MRKKSLFSQLTLGLLIGILIMPARPAQAQFGFGVVFDPKAYALQIEKRIEEAQRYVEMFDNAVQQLTTLKGVLEQSEELLAKQRNAITTISNIGRTVRASFQLKEQLEAIIKTRLNMLRSIDDRLRRGILDPEADLRDLEEYLRTSIGRDSQDTVANLERLMRMDNTLARWELEWQKAKKGLKDAQSDRKAAEAELKRQEDLPEPERYASCIASAIEKISNCDVLIEAYTRAIDDLTCQIENRKKIYNVTMDERIKFGQQVSTTNQAWTDFNDTLDDIQRSLSKY
jgi:DNA repair exonuclease SbcCD ATPase subunit